MKGSKWVVVVLYKHIHILKQVQLVPVEPECKLMPMLLQQHLLMSRLVKDMCIVIMYTQLRLQVYGVKGPSWLDTVPKFDIIQGIPVDYMHCVLLGVCRQLLLQSMWYIGKQVGMLDVRLLALQPPSEMKQTPRSIEHTLKFWKGY